MYFHVMAPLVVTLLNFGVGDRGKPFWNRSNKRS